MKKLKNSTPEKVLVKTFKTSKIFKLTQIWLNQNTKISITKKLKNKIKMKINIKGLRIDNHLQIENKNIIIFIK